MQLFNFMILVSLKFVTSLNQTSLVNGMYQKLMSTSVQYLGLKWKEGFFSSKT
jgi:hypothetical protein